MAYLEFKPHPEDGDQDVTLAFRDTEILAVKHEKYYNDGDTEQKHPIFMVSFFTDDEFKRHKNQWVAYMGDDEERASDIYYDILHLLSDNEAYHKDVYIRTVGD